MTPEEIAREIQENYNIGCVIGILKREAREIAEKLPEPIKSIIIEKLDKFDIDGAQEELSRWLGDAVAVLDILGDTFKEAFFGLISRCRKDAPAQADNNELKSVLPKEKSKRAGKPHTWFYIR